MIRTVIYRLATVVFVVAAFLFPEFRFLYLPCAVLSPSGGIKGYQRLASAAK